MRKEAYCDGEGRMWESSQIRGRDPSLRGSASDGGPGGEGRRRMGLREKISSMTSRVETQTSSTVEACI